MFPRFPIVAALVVVAVPVAAQPVDPAPVVDNSAPASDPADQPICTDRPTKSNYACTVPKGMFQVETDIVNWSRQTLFGGQTDTILGTNPVLKYGVGTATDLEVGWAPYVHNRTRLAEAVTTHDGVGDVFLRVKQRLTDSSSPAQFSLIGYVKAPTAPLGIGNGQWEGGVIAPLNVTLPKGFILTIVPEGDILADQQHRGSRHGQFVGLVNLGYAITPKVTLYGELWTSQNFDPTGTVAQYSADFAVARTIGKNFQVDVGGNLGLNHNTPDIQLYTGVSFRF